MCVFVCLCVLVCGNADVDECATSSHGCKDICTNFEGGFHCACSEGFYLLDDQKSCADINECGEMSPCEQRCQNLFGRFSCSCFDGYMLDSNGTTCSGEMIASRMPFKAAFF